MFSTEKKFFWGLYTFWSEIIRTQEFLRSKIVRELCFLPVLYSSLILFLCLCLSLLLARKRQSCYIYFMTTVKHLSQPSSGDANTLLSG